MEIDTAATNATNSTELPAVDQMKIDEEGDEEAGGMKAVPSDGGTPSTSDSANASAIASNNTTHADQDDNKNENNASTDDAKPEDDFSSSTEDEDDDDDDDDDDTGSSSKKDPELLLIKANTLKEEGNKFFKEKDFEKASRAYRRGTNAIKSLNQGNTGDEQVKSLLISLQTNLSMMSFKLKKYKQSAQVASSVLAIDSTNVKALYRRAVARRQMGDSDLAKADLKEALRQDPANTTVKKEWASLKRTIDQAKEAQKKGLQKAFSKSKTNGLGLLYDDKEREEKRKAEEAKRKKEQEEELLKKRKAEWEDECVKRMAKGEEAVSFDEWEKERKAKEEEENKRKEEERRKAREASRQAQKAAKANNDDDDDSDDELTEKELAQLRGYKKTSDGKVTSYFTREQSAHEKSLIGDIAPKRLESSNTSSSSNPQLSAESGKGNPSAWNQAGTTWEEKNTTDWCRERLETRLKQTKVQLGDLTAVVTGVKDMTGDASVAIASGKKRYIFDFHCKVRFDIRDSDTDDAIGSGTLKLPDICSTHHEELEIEIGTWKKAPDVSFLQKATDCRHKLIPQVRESVKSFVDDFNNEY